MRNLKRLAVWLTMTALLFCLSFTAFAAVEDTGFSDVDAGAWYAEAVAYVQEHGIMNGTTSTAFSPDATTTRGQMAAILYRAAGSPAGGGDSLAGFSDVADSAYYAQAVHWANAGGIITGYSDGTFQPDSSVTRQQMTTILWRYAGSPAGGTASTVDAASVSSYAAAAVNWAVSDDIVAPVSDGLFAPQAAASRAQIAAAIMNLVRGSQAGPETSLSGGAKVLVAYFSATNTTKPLAEYVADGLDAGLYEIVPETPYTSEDLNYSNSSSRATVEMNTPDARPAISGSVDNMEQYDIVFIGYPIWWGQAPRIISTFLESYDFSGKTIVPFCTSGSSGIGSSAQNLHALASGATWLEGQRFSGGTSRSVLIQWVNGLGLDITAK